MKKQITIVSSNRADLTILDGLLNALAKADDVDLSVIATGMHVSDDALLREVIPADTDVYFAGTDLGSGPNGAAKSMGNILAEGANILEDISPDLLFITGDRLDMAPVAMASVPFNIPIMHLHGGEITLGAIDDRLRHAITKLAHIHCASTKTAAARLIAMGEEPWRVHVTGAPALDSLLAVDEMSTQEFCSRVGISDAKKLRLVTVHPETNSNSPLAPAEAILSALAICGPAPTVVSAPNSDPGGDTIRSMLQEFAAVHPWFAMKESLGKDLYANAMRFAKVMVGNTSSGLLEAGLFGLPVVNVGDRQKGREFGENVSNVPASSQSVATAINNATERNQKFHCSTPYGDGNAVSKIMNIIRDLPDQEQILMKHCCES